MDKWKMVRLGDVLSETITGEWGEVSNDSSGVKVLRTTNFTNKGVVDFTNVAIRSIPKAKVDKKRLLPCDIILEKSGGTDNQPVGRVIYFEKLNDIFLCNNFTQILRVKANIAYSKYIFYYLFYLHRIGVTELLQNKTTGIRNLEVKNYMALEIPLPPLAVQEKIADVLDRAAALIEKRKAQIAKLDLLVKSQFVTMFGDPVTNPRGWQVKKLGEIGELNRGISKHRPRNDPKLLGGIYPLIQTGEVAAADLYIKGYSATYSEIGLKQSKMWPRGTLCITIAANIAKTAILDIDACFPDSIVGFTPGECASQLFIHFWFSFFQEMLEEQAPQSAQKNINLQILRDIMVIMPPMDLQNDFTEFVDNVEVQKLRLKKSLTLLELNHKSLMQKCFKGDVF